MLFLNRSFDKKRLKALLLWFRLNLSEGAALKAVEILQELGFRSATQGAISLGLDDLKTPANKGGRVFQAQLEVALAHHEHYRGNRTPVELFQHLVDTWHRTSQDLTTEVVQLFHSTERVNPVYMMAFSGARGNISQVRQLVGMRGLMADPRGQIVGFPILSNFREGLTITEYFVSCYGARKGVVDTAIRTADAGYLTRRLADVSHHVVVRTTNCGTHRSIQLRDIKEGQKTILSLASRLVGRVLAEHIYISHQTNLGTQHTEGSKPHTFSTLPGVAPLQTLLPVVRNKTGSGPASQVISASHTTPLASPKVKQTLTEGRGGAPEVVPSEMVKSICDKVMQDGKKLIEKQSIDARPYHRVYVEGMLGKQDIKADTAGNNGNENQNEYSEVQEKFILTSRNSEITPSLASKLAAQYAEISVRSPLSCSLPWGVCQLCYGWGLSEGRRVTLGEAVGIIAAQSIGEPGTQLTLRTFHTGGVFSGELLNEIRSPYNGIILFPKPLQGVLLRTPHGQIAFLTKVSGQMKVASFPSPKENFAYETSSEKLEVEKIEEQEFVIHPSTVIFVRQNEQVYQNQLLAEFSSSTLQSANDQIEITQQVLSETAGQVWFKKLDYGNRKGPGSGFLGTHFSSQNLGGIWVLAGAPRTATLTFNDRRLFFVDQSKPFCNPSDPPQYNFLLTYLRCCEAKKQDNGKVLPSLFRKSSITTFLRTLYKGEKKIIRLFTIWKNIVKFTKENASPFLFRVSSVQSKMVRNKMLLQVHTEGSNTFVASHGLLPSVCWVCKEDDKKMVEKQHEKWYAFNHPAPYHLCRYPENYYRATIFDGMQQRCNIFLPSKIIRKEGIGYSDNDYLRHNQLINSKTPVINLRHDKGFFKYSYLLGYSRILRSIKLKKAVEIQLDKSTAFQHYHLTFTSQCKGTHTICSSFGGNAHLSSLEVYKAKPGANQKNGREKKNAWWLSKKWKTDPGILIEEPLFFNKKQIQGQLFWLPNSPKIFGLVSCTKTFSTNPFSFIRNRVDSVPVIPKLLGALDLNCRKFSVTINGFLSNPHQNSTFEHLTKLLYQSDFLIHSFKKPISLDSSKVTNNIDNSYTLYYGVNNISNKFSVRFNPWRIFKNPLPPLPMSLTYTIKEGCSEYIACTTPTNPIPTFVASHGPGGATIPKVGMQRGGICTEHNGRSPKILAKLNGKGHGFHISPYGGTLIVQQLGKVLQHTPLASPKVKQHLTLPPKVVCRGGAPVPPLVVPTFGTRSKEMVRSICSKPCITRKTQTKNQQFQKSLFIAGPVNIVKRFYLAKQKNPNELKRFSKKVKGIDNKKDLTFSLITLLTKAKLIVTKQKIQRLLTINPFCQALSLMNYPSQMQYVKEDSYFDIFDVNKPKETKEGPPLINKFLGVFQPLGTSFLEYSPGKDFYGSTFGGKPKGLIQKSDVKKNTQRYPISSLPVSQAISASIPKVCFAPPSFCIPTFGTRSKKIVAPVRSKMQYLPTFGRVTIPLAMQYGNNICWAPAKSGGVTIPHSLRNTLPKVGGEHQRCCEAMRNVSLAFQPGVQIKRNKITFVNQEKKRKINKNAFPCKPIWLSVSIFNNHLPFFSEKVVTAFHQQVTNSLEKKENYTFVKYARKKHIEKNESWLDQHVVHTINLPLVSFPYIIQQNWHHLIEFPFDTKVELKAFDSQSNAKEMVYCAFKESSTDYRNQVFKDKRLANTGFTATTPAYNDFTLSYSNYGRAIQGNLLPLIRQGLWKDTFRNFTNATSTFFITKPKASHHASNHLNFTKLTQRFAWHTDSFASPMHTIFDGSNVKQYQRVLQSKEDGKKQFLRGSRNWGVTKAGMNNSIASHTHLCIPTFGMVATPSLSTIRASISSVCSQDDLQSWVCCLCITYASQCETTGSTSKGNDSKYLRWNAGFGKKMERGNSTNVYNNGYHVSSKILKWYNKFQKKTNNGVLGFVKGIALGTMSDHMLTQLTTTIKNEIPLERFVACFTPERGNQNKSSQKEFVDWLMVPLNNATTKKIKRLTNKIKIKEQKLFSEKKTKSELLVNKGSNMFDSIFFNEHFVQTRKPVLSVFDMYFVTSLPIRTILNTQGRYTSSYVKIANSTRLNIKPKKPNNG